MNIDNSLSLKYVLPSNERSQLPVFIGSPLWFCMFYNKRALIKVAPKVNSDKITFPTNFATPKIRFITHIVKHILATNQ